MDKAAQWQQCVLMTAVGDRSYSVIGVRLNVCSPSCSGGMVLDVTGFTLRGRAAAFPVRPIPQVDIMRAGSAGFRLTGYDVCMIWYA